MGNEEGALFLSHTLSPQILFSLYFVRNRLVNLGEVNESIEEVSVLQALSLA